MPVLWFILGNSYMYMWRTINIFISFINYFKLHAWFQVTQDWVSIIVSEDTIEDIDDLHWLTKKIRENKSK